MTTGPACRRSGCSPSPGTASPARSSSRGMAGFCARPAEVSVGGEGQEQQRSQHAGPFSNRASDSWNFPAAPTEYIVTASKTLTHEHPAADGPGFGRAASREDRRRRSPGLRAAVQPSSWRGLPVCAAHDRRAGDCRRRHPGRVHGGDAERGAIPARALRRHRVAVRHRPQLRAAAVRSRSLPACRSRTRPRPAGTRLRSRPIR